MGGTGSRLYANADYNVGCVGCLGTFTTVLWVKVSGVDYVESTVNNLKSI